MGRATECKSVGIMVFLISLIIMFVVMALITGCSSNEDQTFKHYEQSPEPDKVITSGWVWDNERKLYVLRYVLLDRSQVTNGHIISDYEEKR